MVFISIMVGDTAADRSPTIVEIGGMEHDLATSHKIVKVLGTICRFYLTLYSLPTADMCIFIKLFSY